MIRRAWSLFFLLALVSGCGLSSSSTPTEQGEVLLRSGDYDQAIVTLTEAIDIAPRDSQAHLFRGRAYQCRNGAGDLAAAINDFTTAIELDPKNYEAYYSRSIAFRDRGALTASEEDASKSLADHAMARKLDPGILGTYEPTTESDAEEEPVAPPPIEATTKDGQPERESPVDARRRIEAAAAAAAQDDAFTPNGQDNVGVGASPFDSVDAASRARQDAEGEKGGKRDAKENGRSRFGTVEDRLRPRQTTGADSLPMANPIPVVPPTLSPLTPSANSSAAPLTPTPTLPAPHRGGTLPPVAASPFAAPSPYGLPQGAAGSASTLPGSSPYQSPFQSPFQTRFSPTLPAPTGIVRSQTLPPTTGPQQPRPLVTPIPGRINFPATTRPGIYNP
ncbi:MAG: tetratricopeptide repeat protein [Pirellulales bacterium]